jgi:hypothetical protein
MVRCGSVQATSQNLANGRTSLASLVFSGKAKVEIGSMRGASPSTSAGSLTQRLDACNFRVLNSRSRQVYRDCAIGGGFGYSEGILHATEHADAHRSDRCGFVISNGLQLAFNFNPRWLALLISQVIVLSGVYMGGVGIDYFVGLVNGFLVYCTAAGATLVGAGTGVSARWRAICLSLPPKTPSSHKPTVVGSEEAPNESLPPPAAQTGRTVFPYPAFMKELS